MNNQKGNILMSLLLIMIILSILSIGVYRISYSAGRQAQFSRDNSQAYYLAKSAADLVIDNIEQIIHKVENTSRKDFEIEFFNEGKGIISLKFEDDYKEIIINSTGVVNENKRYESRSNIQARLKFNSISGEVSILGVTDDGAIYEFDEKFENPQKIDIKDNNGNEIRMTDPRAFAWNGENTLILVGGKSGNTVDTLICDLSSGQWIEPERRPKGNGFRYIVYSEDANKYYAINTNNDKINYLDINEGWDDIHKPKAGFEIEKLAQGNNAIVGISKDKDSQITYLIDDNEEWESKTINLYGMEEVYSGITYGKKEGKGKFVIVGNKKHNTYPIFIFSENGIDWHKGIQQNTISDINYELNDVTWTGEKFVAVGNSGVIYTSVNGRDWHVFEREKIIKGEGAISDYWFNYSKVSGYGDYIIAYSDRKNGRLVSNDGGETWTEKGPIKYGDTKIELIDFIVINKTQGKPDFTKPIIHWSK